MRARSRKASKTPLLLPSRGRMVEPEYEEKQMMEKDKKKRPNSSELQVGSAYYPTVIANWDYQGLRANTTWKIFGPAGPSINPASDRRVAMAGDVRASARRRKHQIGVAAERGCRGGAEPRQGTRGSCPSILRWIGGARVVCIEERDVGVGEVGGSRELMASRLRIGAEDCQAQKHVIYVTRGGGQLVDTSSSKAQILSHRQFPGEKISQTEGEVRVGERDGEVAGSVNRKNTAEEKKSSAVKG
ncbi:hypothetical protein C8R43DRAFT_1162484 [Mycena crocata]|nr:hypothetical protein C8R43DRAFT_1162484 [Mycena crocata]